MKISLLIEQVRLLFSGEMSSEEIGFEKQDFEIA